MSANSPVKFTLEDGVLVEVNKSATNTYDFSLTGKEGTRHFTYVDNGDRLKDEELLDFDQLNAVRRYWLEQHDIL
ncbi:MAG TPA: hypothetical protein VF623_16135 [Segetibacter sp.]|jgi:hypothetical protein